MGIASSFLASFLAKQIFGRTIGEFWRVGRRKVLNKFGIKTAGQKLEERLENVESELAAQRESFEWATEKIDEKDEQLSEKERRIRRVRRIIRSLERKGVSRKELIQKFERPIPVLLVAYTRQQESDQASKFVRDALIEELEARNLGGGSVVAPPKRVLEAGLTDSDSLEKWFEEEVYEGLEERQAIIKHATIADLRKDVFWRDDYDFDSSTGSTVGQMIPLSEVLEEDVIMDMIGERDRAALQELIQEGDIGFFISRWVEEDSLDVIHANQAEIEERLANQLGSLDLAHLASASAAAEIATVMGDYLSLPEEKLQEIGEGVVDEANIWRRELSN